MKIQHSHDNNIQYTRNRKELPQPDKDHLQKHPQLTSYLMMNNLMFSRSETGQEQDNYIPLAITIQHCAEGSSQGN